MNISKNLDPELESALIEFSEISFNLDNLIEIRGMLDQETRENLRSQPRCEGVIKRDLQVPGLQGAPDVMVRVYEPEKRPAVLAGFFWIHGGGYVSGIPEQDDMRMGQLVKDIGCVAVSVDYRLAPENPYPAPLEDCYAALKWMFEQSDELGVDIKRIAIGGGSAGGGLAAGLALLARDRKELGICYQLLLYPMLDDRNTLQAGDGIPDTFFWTRHNNLFGWTSYLNGIPGADGVSHYAAAARAEDLTGLPPAFIAVGDIDLLAEEDILFARGLVQAGVPVELHVYPGAFHAFDVKVPAAGVSKRCNAEVAQALKRVLA
jgi:acetyl esterase/lipase